MGTKRKRLIRSRVGDLSPEELQWLKGEPVKGASNLWSFRRGVAKSERCRLLLKQYAHLVPRGRMAGLRRDIERWRGPQPSGLATFRSNDAYETD